MQTHLTIKIGIASETHSKMPAGNLSPVNGSELITKARSSASNVEFVFVRNYIDGLHWLRFHPASSPAVMPLLALRFALCWALLISAAAGSPFVERIDPPSLQRGATTRVTLKGRHLEQAIGVWSSTPGTAWSAKVIESPQCLSDSQHARFPELHLPSEIPGRTPQRPTHDCIVEVTVPSDLPLGMYGLRLVTQSGFSNLCIVAVDELPTARHQPLKTDRKDRVPVEMTLPASISSDCRSGGIDHYAINVTAGQRVSFEVIGNRLGKDFDPLVTIRDAIGRTVLQRDNDVGLFFDCRFEHTFDQAGRYVVEVRDARFDGHPYWNYVLRMGDFPAARVAVPSMLALGSDAAVRLPEVGANSLPIKVTMPPRSESFFLDVRTSDKGLASWLPFAATTLENRLEAEPNNELEQATPAAVPGILHGVLQASGDQDVFVLELKKGQSFLFEAAARELGSPADLELVMFDAMGKEIRRVDDFQKQRNGVQTTYEARFDFNVGQDGIYKLLVRDMSGSGGSAYAYRVKVDVPQPVIELTADYAAFSIPQKSWQPLPITVARERMAGAIELELLGAPAGVTLEPRTIPTEANEIVCKLMASDSAPVTVSTVQIVGRCVSADGKQTAEALVKSYPQIDRVLRNKDRIPYAPRDNQSQLPPSVPDRLAMQITPAAPFEVDVPLSELLMTKYQTASFPIETTRANGFMSPISFMATGGQIGTEEEERDNVFLKAPDATVATPRVEGVFFNRILTQYQKRRADLFAIAEHDGHYITLMRPFQLDVRSAFKPSFEPSTLSVEPGQTAKVKLLANRTPTFAGEVILEMQQPVAGISLGNRLVIPAGKLEIELEFTVASDVNAPRRLNPRFQSTGYVGKYEEEINEPVLNIDVTKPKDPPKTK